MSRAVLSKLGNALVFDDTVAVTTLDVPRGARARVRQEMTTELKDIARRQLTEVGSAGLSLRAIAREMGVVSSAVYRYFPSRDELLTALIVDAYDALGARAEQAERAVRRTDFAGRWMAAARAVRGWALATPQEYALIFGSPVPGYRAPQDTIDPAARLPLLLVGILADAVDAGRGPTVHHRRMPRSVRADLAALAATAAPRVAERQLAVGMTAWIQLIGSISFELFGHLHNVVHDYDGYFEYQLRGSCTDLGLIAASTGR